MYSAMWYTNRRTRRNRYPIRKRKVFQHFAPHADLEVGSKVRILFENEAQNVQIPPPASRCDSLTKLSTFLSLPIADLVQPSSFITASTSSRMSGAYSGRVAKLNRAFENA